jgi:pimeloyl-ACP methyl ester carboxylesterase
MSGPVTSLFEGCALSYAQSGDGPPVVFIQGVGVHGSGWAPQVASLRTDYTCLTFDNRGIGNSQPLGASLSVTQMARDAVHLMDQVGWSSAHIVGHSMGGPIAMQMALDNRDRVRSLSLLCTVGRGRDATRLTGRMLVLGALSRIGSRRSRRRAFLRIVMSESALRGVDVDALAAGLEGVFGHELADQPPVTMKQVAALRAFDATAQLGRLEGIPTLVVSAAEDPIAPPLFGVRLAQSIPGARYEEVPDASHGVTIQHADRINALLRSHMAQAEAALR